MERVDKIDKIDKIPAHVIVPLCTTANHTAFVRVGLADSHSSAAVQFKLFVKPGCSACSALEAALEKSGAIKHKLVAVCRQDSEKEETDETDETEDTSEESRLETQKQKGQTKQGGQGGQARRRHKDAPTHHIASVVWPHKLCMPLASRVASRSTSHLVSHPVSQPASRQQSLRASPDANARAIEVILDAKGIRSALQAPKPRKPLPHQARDLAILDAIIDKANKAHKAATTVAPRVAPTTTTTTTATTTATAATAATATRVLVKYKMGSGKTALMGLFLQLDRVPAAERELVVVVCSNTLIEMWTNELQHWSAQVRGTHSEVHVVGYTEFHRLVLLDADCVAGATVIVDEAHYFRNLTAPMVDDVYAMQQAARLMLLTGTPIVNNVSEAHGLLALLGKEDAATAKALEDAGDIVPMPALMRALKEKDVLILDYDPRSDPALAHRFPKTERRIERVEMSWLDVLAYKIKQRKDTTFGNLIVCTSQSNAYRVASRTSCNTAAKIERVKQFLLELHAARRLPAMVYSNFREKGLDLVSSAFKTCVPQLRVAELNGDTPGAERQRLINAANSGKVDIQLISEAAGVGTNFCGGFHSIVLLEALENVQTQEQVENRVVRLDAAPTLLKLADEDSESREREEAEEAGEKGEGGEDDDIPFSSSTEFISAAALASAALTATTASKISKLCKGKGEGKGKAKKQRAADAETITLVQMLSVFPKNPPTSSEARQLNLELAKLVDDHDVNVAADLVAYVKAERETVDERMVRQNNEKHAAIQCVLEALKTVAQAFSAPALSSSSSSSFLTLAKDTKDTKNTKDTKDTKRSPKLLHRLSKPQSPQMSKFNKSHLKTQAKTTKTTKTTKTPREIKIANSSPRKRARVD